MGHPHGLMFHHFRGRTHPEIQGAIDADELFKLIDHIGTKRFLRPDEWIAKAVAGRLESDDRCITFDDALLSQYEIALPVLQELGLKAFWFIYSGPFEGQIERFEIYRYFRNVRFLNMDEFYHSFYMHVENSKDGHRLAGALQDFDPTRYLSAYEFYSESDRTFRFVRDHVLGVTRYFDVMDSMIESDSGFSITDATAALWMRDEHLRDLVSKEHEIGLHSYTHPTDVGGLPRDEQEREYARNADHLVSLLGRPIVSMAHPCNSYNDDTLDLLAGMGVTVGFRSDMCVPAASTLEFPREDHSHMMARLGLK